MKYVNCQINNYSFREHNIQIIFQPTVGMMAKEEEEEEITNEQMNERSSEKKKSDSLLSDNV